MKRKLFILVIMSSHLGLFAQVGVKTENPKGVFHIDGKGNTNAAGTTNTSDDIVVSGSGNMSIGNVSPQAKLHITTNSATPAIRIADDTQAATRILSSDANGNTFWIDQPSSGGKIYSLTGAAVTNYPETLSLLQAIPVTESGNYLVIIRWWGTTDAVTTSNLTSAYLSISESSDNTAGNVGTLKDRIEYYVYTKANTAFCFTTSLYGSFQAGQYLKIFILPAIGGGSSFNWKIGTASPTDKRWNPSIVIFRV